MSNEKLTENQLDLLKEIGSIGSASAATALAGLIDKKVDIIVPRVQLVPLDNIADLLGGMERLYFVSVLEIEGDITGTIFLLFSLEHAKQLTSILLSKLNEKPDLDVNNELFQSCLKESANILCCSYISALSEMSKLNIIPSVPSLARDMVGAILDYIFIHIAQEAEQALIIKTDVNISDSNVEGLFFLFPSKQSLTKIFDTFNMKDN